MLRVSRSICGCLKRIPSADRLRIFRRAYSTVDRVTVPCGSNGSIVLDVHESPAAASPASIILYLPPGPVLPVPGIESILAQKLSFKTNATVVRINYRSDSNYRYPTPIHDVLFGYDWVLRNLVPQRAIARPGRSSAHPIRIGVLGELVGGSLAAMLALTECHPDGPHIAASAVNEPLVDWVFPEQSSDEEKLHAILDPLQSRAARARKRTLSFLECEDGLIKPSVLLQARHSLFSKPEGYFDPFASPALFFRSPGALIPKEEARKPMDDFDELAEIEQQDFHRQQMRLGALSNVSMFQQQGLSDSNEGDLTARVTAPRKSSRRYPRAGSGLRLPNFRITCAQQSPLFDQALEFTELIRRSRLREAEAQQSETERMDAIEIAQLQDTFDARDNTQLWSTGSQDIDDVAAWFKDIL